MDLFFYDVDPEYVKYLKQKDFSQSKNFGRKEFLRRQWVYCNSIADDIRKMAIDAYNSVIGGKDKSLVNASCDFKLLEEAASNYLKEI